jgi:flavin-dependent dehydrogenase
MINKVVIVGGGSAGWMTAATIKTVFPEKDVVVIESPDTPTVGVGESTLGFINRWFSLIGINKEDFMKDCDASYKLSIKFTDFYKKDYGSFHYPFGSPTFDLDDVAGGSEDWFIKKNLYPDTPLSDYVDTYYPVMQLVNSNKFTDKTIGYFNPQKDAAVHFDAALFGVWLKNNFCIPKGVELIEDSVSSFTMGENGINELHLNSGISISADLFIDCTGFKSLLLGNYLKEDFIDYSDMLPNNRAWATRIPYTDKEKELEPFTSCTAISNGWVWNIPSWNRVGTGYVYSDKYISPEDALNEFKSYLRSDKMTVPDSDRDVDSFEYKDIKMRVGIHKRTWVKNVVAIGLSAGFIEPLESSGLFTVHEFLISLCQTLERDEISQWDKDIYNYNCFQQFNAFADFVALHYALSVREDSKYWKDIKNKTFYPDMVQDNFTNHRTPIDFSVRKFYTNNWSDRSMYNGASMGLNCVATGMNYPIATAVSSYLKYSQNGIDLKSVIDSRVEQYDIRKKEWEQVASESNSLMSYLSERIYNEN